MHAATFAFISQIVANTLLHSLWQCTLLAVALYLGVRWFRPVAARTRYLLSVGTFCLMALVPLGTLALLWQTHGGATAESFPAHVIVGDMTEHFEGTEGATAGM
ncbi:MAG TPA: hypothetical protein DCY79_12650, partial [Planctomycetaceae bacterium]|nr:hypothetical protein [Planctomycetaceae bacterium]